MAQDPSSSLRDILLHSLHELFSDARLTPTAQRHRLTIRTPLLMIFYSGAAAVFLLAAAGHLALLRLINQPLTTADVLLTAIIIAPALATALIAGAMISWRRTCESHLSRRTLTITSRWLLGSSQFTANLTDTRIRLRTVRAWLGRGTYEVDVATIEIPGSPPLIIASGKLADVQSQADHFSRQLGIELDKTIDPPSS